MNPFPGFILSPELTLLAIKYVVLSTRKLFPRKNALTPTSVKTLPKRITIASSLRRKPQDSGAWRPRKSTVVEE